MSTIVKDLMNQIKSLTTDERAEFSRAYFEYSSENLKRLRQASHDEYVRRGMSEEDVDRLIDQEIAELRAESRK